MKRSDVISLSPQLVDELFACVCLLVIVIEIDLRLQPCPRIVASDVASSMQSGRLL